MWWHFGQYGYSPVAVEVRKISPPLLTHSLLFTSRPQLHYDPTREDADKFELASEPQRKKKRTESETEDKASAAAALAPAPEVRLLVGVGVHAASLSHSFCPFMWFPAVD